MQTSANQPHVILHNGVVFTADPHQPWAQALAVHGNQLLAGGRAADLLPLAGPGTRVLDVRGGTVLPGFNDAHTHYVDAAIREAGS
ncbi:MAG: hypothetical protein AAGU05_06770, partial [Anaerolineaceae bacterium]